jgi:Flp pilus assembly protein TadD
VPLEARAWRSELLLWAHAVDVQPDAALARSNYGIHLLRAHRPDEALVQLGEAERLSGGGPATSMQKALAYEMLGRFDEAEAAARASLLQQDSDEGRRALARIRAKAARPR